MKTTMKEALNPPTKPEYDFSCQIWTEGYRDGYAQTWTSTPDMRRGVRYAMGWLTGRLHRDAPSLGVH